MPKTLSDEELAHAAEILDRAGRTIAEMDVLIDKANSLVDHLSVIETHHGGLLGRDTLRVANELRLELSRWK